MTTKRALKFRARPGWVVFGGFDGPKEPKKQRYMNKATLTKARKLHEQSYINKNRTATLTDRFASPQLDALDKQGPADLNTVG